MRPRVFPAEDGRPTSAGSPVTGCFNEAAGIPRGRPWIRANSWRSVVRLQ